jgi:hypothetical protein
VIPPNRVAVYLTAAAGAAAAIAAPLASLDTTSIVGMGFGLLTILGAAVTWLRGWQAHEARTAGIVLPAAVTAGLDVADTVIGTVEGLGQTTVKPAAVAQK